MQKMRKHKKASRKSSFFSSLLTTACTVLPSFSLALSLYLSEPIGILFMAIGAVLFHEWGHLIAFSLLTHRFPSLHIDRFGLRLCPDLPLLPREELFICLGGPLINILLGLVFCRYFGAFGFRFGAIHFLLAFFNLLPFEGSDGGRMLRLLLLYRFPASVAQNALTFLSAAVLAFFFFLSLYTFYLTGNGLCGVFFAAFSFPWKALAGKDDFEGFKRKQEISGEKKRYRQIRP